jgi:CheY-like chemotaxis protein
MKTPKILILDDEEAVTDLYSDFLEDVPVSIDLCNCPQKAWQQIDTNVYDLIITDIIMPRIDGDEFLKIIRNNKQNSKTPVIIATGVANDLHKSLARTNDNISLIEKPFTQDSFNSLIQNIVGL